MSPARSKDGGSDGGKTIAAVIDSDGWSGPTAATRSGELEPFSPNDLSGRNNEPAVFEHAVFGYLFDHKGQLSIRAVLRARALRVDGLVELDDGRRIAVEVKYRLNWAKATQALRQIEWFHEHPDVGSVDGGLVFFEEFSGDWARPISKTAPNGQAGWRLFDEEAAPTKSNHGLSVRAIRLRGGADHLR